MALGLRQSPAKALGAATLVTAALVSLWTLAAPPARTTPVTEPSATGTTAELKRLEQELKQEQNELVSLQAQREREIAEHQARRAELKRALKQARAGAEPVPTRASEEPPAQPNPQAPASPKVLLPLNLHQRLSDLALKTSEQLRLALSAVPGHETELKELKAMEERLRPQADRAKDGEKLGPARPHPAEITLALLTLLDRTHAALYQVVASNEDIWTQNGRRQSVKLLRAGHVAFAYDTGSSQGLALKHAEGKVGYRWAEELPPQNASTLSQALATPAGQLVNVPFDVSGKLTPKSLLRGSSFREALHAGGLVMIPLGLVALAALLLILERTFVLYRQNQGGSGLGSRVLESARLKEYEAAEHLCQGRPSALSRSLAAVLKQRARGREAMEDSMQEQLLHELPRLSRFIGGIAVLAAIAPLLGLLGTVTGIIKTFRTLRAVGHSNIELLAGGISEALTTTAAGLVVAIPVLVVHSLLKGRVERILADAERHGATLVNTIAR